MATFKMGSTLLLLALCAVGVLSNEAKDAWDSRQRRLKGEGHSPSKFSGRIVGGSELKEPLPYQLSLRESGNHICGASIISGQYALSAAHCQNPPSNVSMLTLLAGAVLRSNDPNGIIFQVDNVTTHPRFDPRTYANDIAVLHVTTSFLEHPTLAAIPLATELYKLKVNSIGMVSGWGLTAQDSNLAPTLRSVKIPVTSMANCVAQWSPMRIAKTAICAGQSGKDSCNGDSGGPFVQDGVQIGLVSWGADQCGSAYPGIYTYVGNKAMRAFILENSDL